MQCLLLNHELHEVVDAMFRRMSHGKLWCSDLQSSPRLSLRSPPLTNPTIIFLEERLYSVPTAMAVQLSNVE